MAAKTITPKGKSYFTVVDEIDPATQRALDNEWLVELGKFSSTSFVDAVRAQMNRPDFNLERKRHAEHRYALGA